MYLMNFSINLNVTSLYLSNLRMPTKIHQVDDDDQKQLLPNNQYQKHSKQSLISLKMQKFKHILDIMNSFLYKYTKQIQSYKYFFSYHKGLNQIICEDQF